MVNVGRAVGAVFAGAGVWAVLWLGGTRLVQVTWPEIADPTQPLNHSGVLGGYIAYSVILSVLAGWVAGLVRGGDPMRVVWVLAGIQLALGIAAEVAYWDLLPIWYHLVFLALLVPATVGGGVLAKGRVVEGAG